MNDGDPGILAILFYVAVAAFYLYVLWRIFEKAGKPGWAALIPIYNIVVMLEIVGRPWWWVLLFFIPLVSLVVTIIVSLDVSKSFGHATLFGLGLAFLGFIFAPILAFGSDTYRGPSVESHPTLHA